MPRIVVLDSDYSFGNLNLSGTNLQLDGRSSQDFVVKIGNDYFDFFGSGFTYDQGKLDILGTTVDFNIDLVTGGTINSVVYREDGVPTYALDGFSFSPDSLGDLDALTNRNGPLLFSNLLSGDDQVYFAGGNDTINTAGGNDLVFGGEGNDSLSGGDGFDVILGQAGNDVITGGYNGDILIGGIGADTFVFTHALDSTMAQADSILDFTPGLDKIDLSSLDPIPGVAGDQAFTFIGAAPITAQGQVQQWGNTLFFDADGDGGFEAIVLPTGVQLTAADFVF